jgi:hypothetical protein
VAPAADLFADADHDGLTGCRGGDGPDAGGGLGAGPRYCVGAPLAMLEMHLVVATMIQRFRLRRVSGYPVEPASAMVLRPRDGMPMTVEALSPR